MQRANLWDWVKAIATIIVVLFLSLKFYNATFAMNFDFIALLSTVLALFSLGLSAVFYFKATETSNTFYNNTFKFTKDIADLLIRIESGFGERLKSLDEGYNTMRSMITRPKDVDVKQTKEKIVVEENELTKINAEKEKVINDLLEKANIEHEEKEEIKKVLRAKEDESQKLQLELTRLNDKLIKERMRNRNNSISFAQHGDSSSRIEEYLINEVIPNLIETFQIKDNESMPNARQIIRLFNSEYWREGTSRFDRDMIALEYCDPDRGLTGNGVRYLRQLIRRSL